MKWLACLFCSVLSFLFLPGTNIYGGEPPKEPILRLETRSHSARVTQIAVDGRGHFLASSSYDKTVRIWELKTGKLLKVLRPPINEGQDGELFALAISPDGKTIACSGYTGVDWHERAIYLFDVESGSLRTKITGISSTPNRLEYSKDGKYLAALLPGGYGLLLYRTSDFRIVGRDPQYKAPLNLGLDFASGTDGAPYRIATASRDGFIRLYEARNEKLNLLEKVQLPGGKEPQSVKFSPDGAFIAVGFHDSLTVDVISGKDLSYLYSPDTTGIRNRNLITVAWSSEGNHLYAGGMWGQTDAPITIREWDDGGKGPHRDTAADGTIMYMAPVPKGGVAFGTYRGSVGILEKQQKRMICESAAVANFGELVVSHDGTTIGFQYSRSSRARFIFSLNSRVLAQENLMSRSQKVTGPIHSTDLMRVTDWNYTSAPKINGRVIKIASYERSRCYTIVPDKSEVLLGSDRHLRLLDRSGVEKWRTVMTEVPLSVNVSGNGKIAVAALGDGTIQWFRMEDGKKVLSFFPHIDRQRWVVWTANGYYDSSENADELIGWHINRGADREALFYPLARFFEQFYRPDVIEEVLRTLDSDIRIAVRINKALRKEAAPGAIQEPVQETITIVPPPKVTILRVAEVRTSERDQVTVKVIAEDTGGGIDDIWLFHNGKRVMEDGKNMKTTRTDKGFEKIYGLRLLEGENRFSASAFNREKVESDPAELIAVLEGVSKIPDLHLVLIGIDQYKNPDLNLTYAGRDAKSMAEFFTSPAVKKLFGEAFVYGLMNEKATRQNITKLFDEIRTKAEQKDAIVLYIAGHGDIVGGEWFFIPHDLTSPESEEEVKKYGVSAKSLMETLKAFKSQKIFVIIDACKSGGAISGLTGFRGFEDRKVLKQLVRSTGTYVLSASTDKQFAVELKELGHGVFTYTILEGLSGKAGDKKVTVEGLMQYVKNRLPELTEKFRGMAQWPVGWGSGMDFPLALH